MRILIISFFFPPYNTIGAVRAGKQAKYLRTLGHRVHVITAMPQASDESLSLEIPSEDITATRWINVNRPIELLLGGSESVAQQGFVVPGRLSGWMRSVAKVAGSTYKTLTHVPDGQMGWFPFGARAALATAEKWRPDLIFASAWPITSLLVAAYVSRRSGIPWAAELRDLWSENPYVGRGPLRSSIDRRVEAYVLGTASGLVTVSEPLARTLRENHHKPTAVILNGFDVDSHRVAEPAEHEPGRKLRITYTGILYANKRDPSPLFHALSLLGGDSERVEVTFLGRYMTGVLEAAMRFGVEGSVRVSGAVPYAEALAAQREADVLLLLLWDNPAEEGVYTGKIFEYIGARRPILAIGGRHGVAAQLINDRNLGLVASSPESIAEQLRSWLSQLDKKGYIEYEPGTAVEDLSREAQTRKLATFLEGLL